MKKRVICILLTALMIVPAFLTSCSSGDATVNETRSIVELNLYAVTDDISTREAIEAVQDKINLITLSKYKTKLSFFFYTEEEYRNAIDKASEYGAQNPADVFMLCGSDMLYSYAANDKLFGMSESLEISTKLITDYIHSAIINTAKVGDDVYAIPSNKQTDETVYYIVDKALANKYSLDTSKVQDISDFYDFLLKVKQNEAGYVPMEVIPSDIYGFDYMYDANYLLGLANKERGPFDEAEVSTSVGSAFMDSGLSIYCGYIQNFVNAGFFSGTGTGKKAALRVSELTESEYQELYGDENYIRIVYKHPRATTESTLDYAWAVSSYSKNTTRAMEVVMLLTTNTEAHNIFTFGIENENYTINDDGTIKLLGENAEAPYAMNFYATGNSLIGYLPEGIDPNYQKDGIANNSNLMPDAFLGFVYTLSHEELSEMQEFRSIVVQYYSSIFSGAANYETLMSQAEQKLDRLGYNEFIKRINAAYTEYIEA